MSDFLNILINLCAISTVENVNTKWSSPHDMELYKLECIQYYMECPSLVEIDPLKGSYNSLKGCIKSREKELYRRKNK